MQRTADDYAEALARFGTIAPSWESAIQRVMHPSDIDRLHASIRDAARAAPHTPVYPPAHQLLAAFAHTPLPAVRVVILGQDPYHGPGQANGLSFSVPRGTPIPPSLRNIYRELRDDLGISTPSHGDLRAWAERGVLLLNTTLTVAAGAAGSHARIGWDHVTDAAIRAVSLGCEHVVFVLWGRHAQAKASLIDTARHLVLRAPHPSPLSASRGFFGSRPFSTANAWLVARGEAPIDWSLPS